MNLLKSESFEIKIMINRIKLQLVSSERFHNNCELPVGICNVCECLV